MSADGLKISKTKGNYAHKRFIETEFSHNKEAKNTRLAYQGYSYDEDQSEIKALQIARRINIVKGLAEFTFYGKVTVDFFTCDKHLLSVVTLCIAFRSPIDDFVIVSDDNTKHYKVKIVETYLYVCKTTVNKEGVSVIERIMLTN